MGSDLSQARVKKTKIKGNQDYYSVITNQAIMTNQSKMKNGFKYSNSWIIYIHHMYKFT